MIVYCEKCNSKFQVDDTKIPEAGIKGRCSVCAHVFLLKKQPAAVEPPAEKKPEAAPVPAAPQAFSVPQPTRHTSNDVIFEVEEGEFEEADELYEAEEVHEADDFRNVFSADTTDSNTTAAHEAFAKFVAQQKPREVPSDDVRAPISAYRNNTGSENVPSARHPEVVADGQWPVRPGASQKPDRAIMTMLDQQGMTDDYVVQMVQEICHATKYVEGVEKPDWQTRIMGLDMLCKIKGLYAAEKRDDSGNRQVQILTGFNM